MWGGEGLEASYERFASRAVGVHPSSVRVSPSDTRDEVFMTAVL